MDEQTIKQWSIVWQNQSHLAVEILKFNKSGEEITIEEVLKLTKQLTRVAVNPIAYYEKLKAEKEGK